MSKKRKQPKFEIDIIHEPYRRLESDTMTEFFYRYIEDENAVCEINGLKYFRAVYVSTFCINKEKVSEYIFNDCGINVSKMLISFIVNPRRLDTLNNKALKQIVIEFAPIYRYYFIEHMFIDGPNELSTIGIFKMFLECRITNKPELQTILNGNDKN